MYLTQEWKDSGISREMMPGLMDPNMTVANTIHNTSLILLHQRIAYPDAELNGIRLPSLCSADTCYNAAMETANITTKYLEGSSSAGSVSPQLAMGAFVSGRVLLGRHPLALSINQTGGSDFCTTAHCRYYKTALAEEFGTLVKTLKAMSHRWTDNSGRSQDSRDPCFFDQLSERLENLHRDYQTEIQGEPNTTTSLDVQVSDFSTTSGALTTHQYLQFPPEMGILPQTNDLTLPAQDSVELGSTRWQMDAQSSPTNSRDELSTISQMLMRNDFLEMDRIISFEDMMPPGEIAQYFKPNA